MNATSRLSDERLSAQREELYALLLDCEIEPDSPLDDRTPLISSGLLTSLALFRVALWVEDQIGNPVNPSTFDVAERWDSVEAILDFIQPATSDQKAIVVPRGSARSAPQLSPWRIIQYTPQYKRAVAELQTSLWCTDPKRNLQYLEWKYERNPCPAPSHIYLALERDDVIGMRSFHPSRWESSHFSGHHLLVADDSVVRGDRRNQGVTYHIMREAMRSLAEQGIDYVFNFSGSPVTAISSLASGWRSIGAVEPTRRRSRMAALRDRVRHSTASTPFLWRYASSMPSFSRSESNPFVRIDRQLDTTLSLRGTRVRISRTPEPERMAQLVHNTQHDGRIRLTRDAAYLRWRFEDPLHEYRFLYLEGERLDGYLVVNRNTARASNAPSPTVHIVDLEAKDDESKLALLEAAAGSNFFDVLVAWSATLPRPCKELLAAIKFAPMETSNSLQGHPCMLVRTTDESQLREDWYLRGMRLTDLENWDMRMIYSMAG